VAVAIKAVKNIQEARREAEEKLREWNT